MFNNRWLIVFAVILTLSGAVLAQTPGTSGDPLVSKSYLDHFFRFRSVVVPENTSLKPDPGALIIVRSGQLILGGPKGKTIVDLTAGKELAVGSELPLNHLLIVPDSAEYKLNARKLTLILASCLQHENP
ncbi:MAG: hypothetical protein ACOYXC_08590 [Candidatus Rifleibacteriota bacterium]